MIEDEGFHDAVTQSLRPGEVLTGFVAVLTMIDGDGAQVLRSMTMPGQTFTATLGLAEYARLDAANMVGRRMADGDD